MNGPAGVLRRLRHEDDGQMLAAGVVFLCVVLLSFCVVALLPVGAATNDKTQSQTAADAGALAAVEDFRTVWVDDVTSPGPTLRFLPGVAALRPVGPSPCAAAGDYAGRHDASLTSCSRDGRTVAVRVRNDYTSYDPNGRAESSATAQTRARLMPDACVWVGTPPSQPLEFGGVERFPATLRCGQWQARYWISNSTATLWQTLSYNGTSRDELYRALEPRLTE